MNFLYIKKLRYVTDWRLLNALDFGVPQLRPRVVFIAIQTNYSDHFSWPEPGIVKPKTVGEVLYDQIAAKGWRGAKAWKKHANEIAPTIVGGSKKHGGPGSGSYQGKASLGSVKRKCALAC